MMNDVRRPAFGTDGVPRDPSEKPFLAVTEEDAELTETRCREGEREGRGERGRERERGAGSGSGSAANWIWWCSGSHPKNAGISPSGSTRVCMFVCLGVGSVPNYYETEP